MKLNLLYIQMDSDSFDSKLTNVYNESASLLNSYLKNSNHFSEKEQVFKKIYQDLAKMQHDVFASNIVSY